MAGWDALLGPLAETPRENGTAGLYRAAAFLEDTLRGAGVEPELVAFQAEPWGLRLAGVLVLAGCVLYFRLLRRERRAAALAVALLLPAAVLLDLDHHLPVFSWIGSETAYHVEATFPAEAPEQRLILAAHYDTKTDLLDHVERAPVDLMALPVTLLLIVAPLVGMARARRRGLRTARRVLGTAAAWAALVYGLSTFAALSAGAFLPARSPGALDDGGSCAVLVRLAEQLEAAAPLDRTEVRLVWLAAEEVGVQGSWVYARDRLAELPPLPTRVVNLEGLGASDDFAVFGSERFTLRAYPPGPEVMVLLDAAHDALYGGPVERTWYGGATDARSFLAHGMPAATLVSREPGEVFARGLHSAADDRSRLDPAALDASLALLRETVRLADAG